MRWREVPTPGSSSAGRRERRRRGIRREDTPRGAERLAEVHRVLARRLDAADGVAGRRSRVFAVARGVRPVALNLPDPSSENVTSLWPNVHAHLSEFSAPALSNQPVPRGSVRHSESSCPETLASAARPWLNGPSRCRRDRSRGSPSRLKKNANCTLRVAAGAPAVPRAVSRRCREACPRRPGSNRWRQRFVILAQTSVRIGPVCERSVGAASSSRQWSAPLQTTSVETCGAPPRCPVYSVFVLKYARVADRAVERRQPAIFFDWLAVEFQVVPQKIGCTTVWPVAIAPP